VPVDPLAGPVGPAIAASHAPRPLQFKTERATAKNEPAAKAEAPKPVANTGVKSAASQADDLEAKAEAIAKQLTNKPGAIAAAKTEANKDAAKVATNKPAAAAPAPAPKVLPPTVKAAADLPAPKPATPAPVQTAAKTPATQKTAAKPKDAIPGLRLSANAY
jgi:hypothetical protein